MLDYLEFRTAILADGPGRIQTAAPKTHRQWNDDSKILFEQLKAFRNTISCSGDIMGNMNPSAIRVCINLY